MYTAEVHGESCCALSVCAYSAIALYQFVMLLQEILCALNLVSGTKQKKKKGRKKKKKSPLKNVTNIYIGISEKFKEMALYMVEKRHIEQASQMKKL